jgi:hypothetical protein
MDLRVQGRPRALINDLSTGDLTAGTCSNQ